MVLSEQNSVPPQILGAVNICMVIAIRQQLTLSATLHFLSNACSPLVATTIKYTHPTVFTTRESATSNGINLSENS